MKYSINFFTLLLFAAALVFTACDKDEDDVIPPFDDPTPTEDTTPVTPQIAGADGSLWAVKSLTTTEVAGMVFDTEIGIAVGAFNNNGDFDDLVDVGTVKADGNTLTKYENNSYSLTPSQTNPTGIDFGNDVEWEVAGGSGFGAFTTTSSIPWPEFSEITSGTTVSKSAGYTVTVDWVTGADSVLFMVGSVIKTIPGNAVSCAFSAGDLADVSTGTSVVTVAPYVSAPETLGGKTIYVGKEAVRSQTVTIEN